MNPGSEDFKHVFGKYNTRRTAATYLTSSRRKDLPPHRQVITEVAVLSYTPEEQQN
jgi:hypothetical protein